MVWLIKNFGLAALGMCILLSAASLEMRLATMEKAYKNQNDMSVKQVRILLPAGVVRRP